MRTSILSVILILTFTAIYPVLVLGECVDGNCTNGTGTFNFTDGSVYIGQFRGGQLTGNGSFTFPDGTKKRGLFNNGKLITIAESKVANNSAAESMNALTIDTDDISREAIKKLEDRRIADTERRIKNEMIEAQMRGIDIEQEQLEINEKVNRDVIERENRRVAQEKAAAAQHYSSVPYYKPSMTKDGLKEIYRRAEGGDVEAQFFLGGTYQAGDETGVVPQNAKEAVYWFQRAAMQGHAPAQCGLGLMYFTGDIIPQDYKTSYIWFRLSSWYDSQLGGTGLSAEAAKFLTRYEIQDAQDAAARMRQVIDSKRGR